MMLLWLSAIMMIVTALAHSILGEKRLITPILALDTDITRRPLAQQVLRMAWHVTSLFMGLTALLVVWPAVPAMLILATGILWLSAGLIDGVVTKGKHVGWLPLTLSGAFAIAGVLT